MRNDTKASHSVSEANSAIHAIFIRHHVNVRRIKGLYSWFTERSLLTATGRHLPYGTCHPTQMNAPSRHALIPASKPVLDFSTPEERNGRLSWPRLPGNAPRPGIELTISRSQVRRPINHYTTEPVVVCFHSSVENGESTHLILQNHIF